MVPELCMVLEYSGGACVSERRALFIQLGGMVTRNLASCRNSKYTGGGGLLPRVV